MLRLQSQRRWLRAPRAPARRAGPRTARRRVWVLGAIMVPVSLVIGWAIGAPLGWSPFLWIASGLGISLGVFYIAYVILAERDDGRIQRDLDEARRQREMEGEGT